MNDIRRVLSYNDVSLCPRNSSCRHISDANILYLYDTKDGFSSVPLVNAPMDKVCSPELLHCLHEKFNMPVTIHRWFSNAKEQLDFFNKCDFGETQAINNVFLSVGSVDKWKVWIDELISNIGVFEHMGGFAFLVDMANGDTDTCVETVSYISEKLPNVNIMAGNVATRSGYCRLEDAGANFIRTGIGGGACCTTRSVNGFGLPTLTSILDCAKVKSKSYLVADGGIEFPGDICKAMAAGADMVMAGKLFAGTSLSAGEKYDKDGQCIEGNFDNIKWVSYRGMASAAAASLLKSKKSSVSVEGVSGFVPYIGETEEVVEGILANLRSSMSYYAGCKNWDQFKKRVKFVEITSLGWDESRTRVVGSIS